MGTELTLPSAQEKNVLLVLRQWEQPSACVANALRLALGRGASLEVLRVLPSPVQTRAKASFMESELLVDERRVTRADTQHWLHGELGGAAARNVRVVVAQGDFVVEGARRAKLSGVGLILVSREVRQFGALITSLARAAERPVLAPNNLIDGKPILAATDMRDSRYPVLWQAAQLASQLHASLVVFHNAAPAPSSEPNPDSSARSSRERLLDVASVLPAPTSTALRSEQDAVRAILNEAASIGAGTIAVGTRGRSWWRRVLSGSVAAEVTERSRLAVLVTPIDGLCAASANG